MTVLIDTNIFLRLAFDEPGAEHCGALLDSIYRGEEAAVISVLQLSELYTPFERAHDDFAKVTMKAELKKFQIKVRSVDEAIAELSSELRATERTPEKNWLPLADSVILATAVTERVKMLYTIDTDFSRIKRVRVAAPEMSLEEWVKRYGNDRQKKALGLL